MEKAQRRAFVKRCPRSNAMALTCLGILEGSGLTEAARLAAVTLPTLFGMTVTGLSVSLLEILASKVD
jgi:hypothetical protein